MRLQGMPMALGTFTRMLCQWKDLAQAAKLERNMGIIAEFWSKRVVKGVIAAL